MALYIGKDMCIEYSDIVLWIFQLSVACTRSCRNVSSKLSLLCLRDINAMFAVDENRLQARALANCCKCRRRRSCSFSLSIRRANSFFHSAAHRLSALCDLLGQHVLSKSISLSNSLFGAHRLHYLGIK
jgi:hypothetical protein